MTSKEKALELYHKFRDKIPVLLGSIRAKQCALICVNEVIDQWEYIDTYISDLGGKLNPNLKYWSEVKKELLKL